jgi:hypothetical protein
MAWTKALLQAVCVAGLLRESLLDSRLWLVFNSDGEESRHAGSCWKLQRYGHRGFGGITHNATLTRNSDIK